MEITVNGKNREYEFPITVDELVGAEVEDDLDQLAVAVNSDVVPREEWPGVKLEAGDDVEIVRPLQGG